jgi:hypothetical protein
MPKFRKKPVLIEAVRYDGANVREIIDFTQGQAEKRGGKSDFIYIPTLEGDMAAVIGDWIIKGVNGEFYPCKPDIFEKTYAIMGMDTELSISVDRIIAELSKDKSDGSYFHAWQCNIAMAFKDEFERYARDKEIEGTASNFNVHEIANNAAINFLNTLCRKTDPSTL